ncbi:MAG: sodium:dicarboxylate symporter [Stygiobacter sp. RIFOXYC12_FULL_38_8]|nr:MAG: sodium:dicarboxylate symporter [Stygiobacter sp. RIFOXYB2_FULL_37_11]OGV10175.1 MAG: sodium:dicarboxylate symporter [Stygiobacter sp. RIFOXYA2_FULL_38_8]OGV13884.1 MAG: sodium:dicarboxylate symporter [Stygiobacter sp. RIFOXYC2_FULL_38_25]OGV26359.1 MAG: sodium:dicarboxylate symporter [Stygiobacter sp. RIFOXYC12_FULL_38_8]OGV80268.1 MAG: sodium:dicarboxylate symporter [Stygiobacter sp. GWF2_38_21]OGV83960.1 MAG: sodium:dicarboxylate symporter [Melioribacter sp. RIFOXYB12_FULL_38_5]
MFKRQSLKKNLFGLLLGVLCFAAIVLFADLGAEYQNAKLVAAVTILMGVLWITEAIPLAATSFIPLILFPLLGIDSGAKTAQAYMNSTIFLFLGGMIIAVAIEKWNLHKRIALNVISIFGTTPSRIVLGFMIATAFISMWINNTSTTLMILPIGLAVLLKVEESFGKQKAEAFAKTIMLGIAYASSIGGIATLIGTAPNMVFQRVYKISFPNTAEINFGEWMKYAIPISIVMLIFTWFLLTKVLFKVSDKFEIDKNIIHDEKKHLGKISYEEKIISLLFFVTCLLWIFRVDLNLEWIVIPGWSNLFPKFDFIDDGTIAITMATLLFVLPSKNGNEENSFLLNHSSLKKIPWDIIILFGGGFAIADGFVSSGLSKLIGEKLAVISGVNIVVLIAIICFAVTALSEIASNTATAQIILPILASISVQMNINPIILMIPATIAASFGFMLPVGTPPNAIVFGSERLHVIDMVKSGVLIDLISVLVITFFAWFFFL